MLGDVAGFSGTSDAGENVIPGLEEPLEATGGLQVSVSLLRFRASRPPSMHEPVIAPNSPTDGE